MRLRIILTDLPGRSWHDCGSVHVGVQRGKEVVGVTPGDAPSASWDMDVEVRDDGDVRGPWVQGKRGDRFVYVTWGTSADPERWGMFRRAKVMLAPVTELLQEAAASGAAVEASTSGKDVNGGPICAALRPPRVTWRVVANG
jgi:hypothetical protein